MKKYTFLIYHKEYTDFLNRLRQLGVVHVLEKSVGIPPEASDLHQMLADESRMNKIVTALSSRVGNTALSPAETADGKTVADQYDALLERRNRMIQQQTTIQKEIERWEPWGNFEISDLTRLAEAGYTIQFFTVPERDFQAEWTELYHAIRINDEGRTVYFVTVTPTGQPIDLDGVEPVKWPEKSLRDWQTALTDALREEIQIDEEIDRFAAEKLNTLKAALVTLREEFEFSKVQLNTERQAEDKLMLLQGWVPVTKEQEVNAFLQSESVYYEVETPSDTENVPILLKNNAFTRLFETVGGLYDLPNYREMDLTPFFAPFFVMFFGLCLGDAGYGLLITIAAFIARRKVKPNLKPIMTLAFWLGLGTVLFGTISGTLFGIPLLDVQWPWIQGLKNFMLNPNQMFNFALIVGVIQIVFGMTLKAIGSTIRFGFLRSLAAWGWLLLVVGCGIAVGLEKLGQVSSETAKQVCIGVVAIAAIGIFLFNDIKRNPLINIGAGIWDSYNMATGLLGDLLSYIRLFALGISGSVMGLVFNDLAISMTENMPIVISQIVMVLILVFGHSMNIFMNGLGAFVHPMRLTFVEFYKNAGFEGGGKPYKPFSRQ